MMDLLRVVFRAVLFGVNGGAYRQVKHGNAWHVFGNAPEAVTLRRCVVYQTN